MSLKAIKNRIKSIKSSKKITDAMQFISATRAKQFQKMYNVAANHVESITDVMNHIDIDNFLGCRSLQSFSNTYKDAHELKNDEKPELKSQPKDYHQKKSLLDKNGNKNKRHLIVLITSDRGLCGQYNSSLIKGAQIFAAEIHNADGGKKFNHEIDYITVGNKANDAIQNMVKSFETRDSHIMSCNIGKIISFQNIDQEIIQPIFKELYEIDYESCNIVYCENKSAIQQEVTIKQIWPLKDDLQSKFNTNSQKKSFHTLPKGSKMISKIIIDYLSALIYKIVIASKLSESNARMVAMDNAGRNSDKALTKLQNFYNNARQASITKEISEIVGGCQNPENI